MAKLIVHKCKMKDGTYIDTRLDSDDLEKIPRKVDAIFYYYGHGSYEGLGNMLLVDDDGK